MKFSAKVARAYTRGGLRGLCGQSLRYFARKIDGYRFDPYILERPRLARDTTSLISRVAAARAALETATLVPRTSTPPSSELAIIVHAFYPEIADRILCMLRDAGVSDHIFISTDSSDKKEMLERSLRRYSASAEIRVFPNRGRDIYPKIFGFSDVHRAFKFELHLHTKKSTHSDHLSGWNDYLLSNLIGSTAIFNSNRALLESDGVGLVYPACYPPIAPHLDWGGNFAAARELSERLKLVIDPQAPAPFPSGSMFFARSAILAPLIDLRLSSDDFPPEYGQTDGTPAHAIERLIGSLCSCAGLRSVQVIALHALMNYILQDLPLGSGAG